MNDNNNRDSWWFHVADGLASEALGWLVSLIAELLSGL
jgi:hypothetical protein